MKRKLLAGLLIFAMLFSLVPTAALANEGETFEVSGLKYKVLTEPAEGQNGTVEVTNPGDSNRFTGTNCTIPETVTNNNKIYDVTVIGEGAFYNSANLTNVNIGTGVQNIGKNAFSSCDALESITIPNNVTSLGEGAFYSCDNLTIVNIGTGVKTIENSVFLYCTALTSVTIPGSVTSIGDNAFDNCTALRSVEIENGVASIGKQAFRDCTSLTSITIPASVTTIEDDAFHRCYALKSATIEAGVTTIGVGMFASTGLTSIVIPDSVTTIGKNAFYNCSNLTSVTIPDSVTSIGEGAFPTTTAVIINHTHDYNMSEYISDETHHWYKCKNCDATNEKAAHSGGTATCTEKAVCVKCGQPYGEKTPHNYSEATCLVPKTCSVCNTTEGEKDTTNHTSDDFTYTPNNDGTHQKVYKCCGAEAEVVCSYGIDNVCDNCGYTKPTPTPSTSDGGFSGDYNYPVVVADTDDAAVKVSEEHAIAGETVTITVTPSSGKQVDEVIVTDEDGEVIAVSKVGDNTYTFTMPKGKVNVAVTTKAIDYDTKVVLQIGNKNVVVDGKPFTNDVAPILVGDRTLVPLRVIIEALGGSVDWDEVTRTVTIYLDGKVLTLVIDEEIPGFGQGATIMDNRTYVPIRYVAEYVGAHVEWIAATQQIVILK